MQIEALIGQGGHGAVHRARELSTGRPVALKVSIAFSYCFRLGLKAMHLNSQVILGANPSRNVLSLFKGEARRMEALGSHPHIVQVSHIV